MPACNLCDYTTEHKSVLDVHRRTRHGIINDTKKAGEPVKHICNTCGYETNRKDNFLRHINLGNCSKKQETIKEPVKHVCDTCGYEASRKDNLKRHLEKGCKGSKCGGGQGGGEKNKVLESKPTKADEVAEVLEVVINPPSSSSSSITPPTNTVVYEKLQRDNEYLEEELERLEKNNEELEHKNEELEDQNSELDEQLKTMIQFLQKKKLYEQFLEFYEKQ